MAVLRYLPCVSDPASPFLRHVFTDVPCRCLPGLVQASFVERKSSPQKDVPVAAGHIHIPLCASSALFCVIAVLMGFIMQRLTTQDGILFACLMKELVSMSSECLQPREISEYANEQRLPEAQRSSIDAVEYMAALAHIKSIWECYEHGGECYVDCDGQHISLGASERIQWAWYLVSRLRLCSDSESTDISHRRLRSRRWPLMDPLNQS